MPNPSDAFAAALSADTSVGFQLPAGLDWLMPPWNMAEVGALMTTRNGGVSRVPFDTMNLRLEVGDIPASVLQNRARLEHLTGATSIYLEQEHGNRVVRLTADDLDPTLPPIIADACVTSEPGIACTIMVADCLPVLFAAPQGRAVGAAHAGWRGLAQGVLEQTLAGVCQVADCEPYEVQVWLGPCIGPTAFEVGADVLQAFGFDPQAIGAAADMAGRYFTPLNPTLASNEEGPKWLGNLPLLAYDLLTAAGARQITGGIWCTVHGADKFFSYRRDCGISGRMAALVWIR
jgi:polyphenol oxidase